MSAVLPDHPTPVEIRTHVKEPITFIIWYKGIEPDDDTYDEVSCVSGSYGLLRLNEFMETFHENKISYEILWHKQSCQLQLLKKLS